MQSGVVVYRSKYGHTARYARYMADALDFALLEGQKADIDTLAGYRVVVYGGGLYAGGIDGIPAITRNFNRLDGSRIAVFTVGLADPEIPGQFAAIRNRHFTPEMLDKIKIFHLRGGIDYAVLGPVHRVMMAALHAWMRTKSSKNRTEEERAFLETYGGRVDFTDFETAAPLIEYVKSLV
jgi:hypothetical protein